MRFVYCLRWCAPQSPVNVATSETARRRLIAGLDLPYFLAIVYHITLNHNPEYLFNTTRKYFVPVFQVDLLTNNLVENKLS